MLYKIHEALILLFKKSYHKLHNVGTSRLHRFLKLD